MHVRRVYPWLIGPICYVGLVVWLGPICLEADITSLPRGERLEAAVSPESGEAAPAAIHVEVLPFRAIGDGLSHPLARRYPNLAAAQLDYPHASALDDELDWAAIQGAINQVASNRAVGGKVVLAANRRYLLNRTLRVLPRLILEGGGASTTLIYTGAGTALEADLGTGRVTNWNMAIKDLTLRAKGGTRGIALRDVADVDLINVAIFGRLGDGEPATGFTEACLYFGASPPPQGATIVVRIRNSFFQLCRGDGIRAGEANAINQISIQQTRIQGNRGWGVHFQVQARALDIQGSDLEGNAAGQVRLAGVLGLHFAGNYLESEASMIELTGDVETRGVVIEGNHMQGAGMGVTPTAIRLGGGRFPAEGVVIKGNWIASVTHALDLRRAEGVEAGPNSFTRITAPVAPTIGPGTRNVTGIPLPPQPIQKSQTTIRPWGGLTLLDVRAPERLTLTATPTLADGLDYQELRLLNIGPQSIVLQDQRILPKSNLRLAAPQVTLDPQHSISLVYQRDSGVWVQVTPVVGSP